MKDALKKIEGYIQEILPGYPEYRCLRPREGAYQERRFYPKMVFWNMGQLMVSGIEDGQPVAFPLLSLYSEWIVVQP